MTKWYEVIYETGTHSVISADSDEEALRGLRAHQARAEAGELGGPAGHSAERIQKILVYDRHPAEYALSMTADVANAQLADLVKMVTDPNGVVDTDMLQAEIRRLADPVDNAAMIESRHNSMYKMQQVGELNLETGESEAAA